MSKGTPHRPIRIDDETWAKAQAKAARLGTSASASARELLEAWVEEEGTSTQADAWDEGFTAAAEYPNEGTNPYRSTSYRQT